MNLSYAPVVSDANQKPFGADKRLLSSQARFLAGNNGTDEVPASD